MTTYVFFRELVEISVQEVGMEKFYSVNGVSMVNHIMQNAADQMTERSFLAFSARVGKEF